MKALHSPRDSAFSRAERELDRISNELGIANSTAAFPSPGQAERHPIGTTPDHPVEVREVGRPTGRLDQLGGIVEPATTALLAVVFTFFVLLQREDLRNRLIRLSGDRNLSRMTQAMSDASRRISLQVAVNIVFGAIVCVALYLIGLPHAVLFAALATLCRFVPRSRSRACVRDEEQVPFPLIKNLSVEGSGEDASCDQPIRHPRAADNVQPTWTRFSN
ncbi:MAG: AI-2E family transporter [Terracidiphilus sp.]